MEKKKKKGVVEKFGGKFGGSRMFRLHLDLSKSTRPCPFKWWFCPQQPYCTFKHVPLPLCYSTFIKCTYLLTSFDSIHPVFSPVHFNEGRTSRLRSSCHKTACCNTSTEIVSSSWSWNPAYCMFYLAYFVH